MAEDKRVQVRLVRSLVGRPRKHRAIAYALGLRKVDNRREHRLTQAVQGMINKISFLLEVKEIDTQE